MTEAIPSPRVLMSMRGSLTPSPQPTVPTSFWADDGGYQWVRSAYAEAAAGHPQKLIDSCRANR